MKRVVISAASMLLFCAVIQACGPQDDSSNSSGSEARGDIETAVTEDHSSAKIYEGTLADAAAGEEDPIGALGEYRLASYESDLHVEGFVLNYQRFQCPGCDGTIRVEHWTRQCSLCSYRKYADYRVSPGEQKASCNDGRRTRVYVYGAYNDRSLYFWDFNFWNCS